MFLTEPAPVMQIRRLCESLTDDAPKSEEMEAFLAHPNHVLARLSRDISQKDVIVASFEKPMQVPLLSVPPSPAYIAAHSVCSALLDTVTERGNTPAMCRSLQILKAAAAGHAGTYRLCKLGSAHSGNDAISVGEVASAWPGHHMIVWGLVQAIVSHSEHDTVYVKDLACRSFSYATLRLMCDIILENMPAGEILL